MPVTYIRSSEFLINFVHAIASSVDVEFVVSLDCSGMLGSLYVN